MGGTVAHHPVRILSGILRAGRETPSGLESLQQERLRRLVAFAREHSVFYGKLYSSLPSFIHDPRILPSVSKRDLMANFDGWATDDAVRRETAEAFVADPGRVGRYYLDHYLAFATSGTNGRSPDHRRIAIPLGGRRFPCGLCCRGTPRGQPLLPRRISVLTEGVR